MRIDLSPLVLDPSLPARRGIPRAPQFRQPEYEDQYDFDTVFYDCFAALDGGQIICLCPPLYDLEPIVLPPLHAAFIGGGLSQITVNRLHLSTQLSFARRTERALLPAGVFRQGEVVVQPNHCELFRGKKVLLTKSKNNELVWIRDWVHFHAANHGSNAVLLYDNASTAYSTDAVRDVLAAIPGIEIAVVVDWPYKFGPRGGPANIWDSDYCQYGVLEHAHHRFLMLAAGVVSADLDELLITRDGTSIYDMAARSSTGYLQYFGMWIENAALAESEPRRHVDYIYRSTTPAEYFDPKWSVVPARGPYSQWIVHGVVGMQNDAALAQSVSYRHFRAINTNWKVQRRQQERPNERDHAVDEELVRWMRVFERPSAG